MLLHWIPFTYIFKKKKLNYFFLTFKILFYFIIFKSFFTIQSLSPSWPALSVSHPIPPPWSPRGYPIATLTLPDLPTPWELKSVDS